MKKNNSDKKLNKKNNKEKEEPIERIVYKCLDCKCCCLQKEITEKQKEKYNVFKELEKLQEEGKNEKIYDCCQRLYDACSELSSLLLELKEIKTE